VKPFVNPSSCIRRRKDSDKHWPATDTSPIAAGRELLTVGAFPLHIFFLNCSIDRIPTWCLQRTAACKQEPYIESSTLSLHSNLRWDSDWKGQNSVHEDRTT